MARLVYGVSGEGSGHSSRSREMITHLEAHGHSVFVVSYGRGYENLQGDFDVFETEGLHIRTEENKVDVVKTFTANLSRLSDGISKLRELRHVAFDPKPDAVITDFEPMTAYLAHHYDLPLITLDNQHRMRYMEYPRPERLAGDALVTETVIRAMVPRPDVSLVTTFYFGDTKNDRTFLFPPILRREVLDLEPTQGESILVYFTQGFDSFLEQLQTFRRERFIVYGSGRCKPTGESFEEGNAVFKPPSRAGFLADLAAAKAVIATAGFTLMTEALHLGKPYLALPMEGQFEQELNALLLEQLRYGKNGHRGSVESVGDFLYRLSDYRDQLVDYPRSNDNREIKDKLDELLADDCAAARAAYAARRS